MSGDRRPDGQESNSARTSRRSGDDDAPWLVIDPVMERALLITLLRRHGGAVKLATDEIRATADVTWAIEGFRTPDDPGVVRVRLRRLD